MRDLLDELAVLLAPRSKDARAGYYRIAPSYDRFRSLWMRLAGKPAEQAMFDDLGETIQPGHRVLAAGCGTGALTRRIQALQPETEITMVDASGNMLARPTCRRRFTAASRETLCHLRGLPGTIARDRTGSAFSEA